MNEKSWFIMKDDRVSGPFTETEATSKLDADPMCYIWGHGMKEWLTFSEWKTESQNFQKDSPTSSLHPDWKYKVGPDIHGPLHYEDMLFELKKIQDYENLEICSAESNEWKSIFMLPKIADHLGITRRRHLRVPIMGQLEAELPSGETGVFRVISISEGGVGLNSAKNLGLGQTFKGLLTSPHLPTAIHCDCSVTYIKENGYVGVEFDSLAAEYSSVIIDYVNKFEKLA